jgi:hypothetical protein
MPVPLTYASVASSTASLSSSIIRGVDEYGRRYAAFGKSGESSIEDIWHGLMVSRRIWNADR